MPGIRSPSLPSGIHQGSHLRRSNLHRPSHPSLPTQMTQPQRCSMHYSHATNQSQLSLGRCMVPAVFRCIPPRVSHIVSRKVSRKVSRPLKVRSAPQMDTNLHVGHVLRTCYHLSRNHAVRCRAEGGDQVADDSEQQSDHPAASQSQNGSQPGGDTSKGESLEGLQQIPGNNLHQIPSH